MASDAMILVVRRAMKRAGWESPTDDLVRQIADELEKELEQGKANESVI